MNAIVMYQKIFKIQKKEQISTDYFEIQHCKVYKSSKKTKMNTMNSLTIGHFSLFKIINYINHIINC